MNGEHEVDAPFTALFTATRTATVTAGRWRKPAPIRAFLPWRSITVPQLRWAVTIGYTVGAFTTILVVFLQPWAPQMIDLDVYRAGASAVLHGSDPYRVAGPAGLPFTYPVFAAMVFVPFALLPELAARATLTVASFAALIVICQVSLRQLAPRLSHRQAALITLPAAVLAVLAHPMLDTLSFGQINLILAAMVLADVFLITGPGRGVLVGLAAGIKLTPGLFILYYLVTGQRREALTAASAAGVTVLAGFAVQPHAAWAYWSHYLLDPGRAGGVTYAENQSILAVTARLMRTTQPPSWLTLSLSAVIVVAAAVIARRTNRAGDELTAVSVIAAAALLASPISWTHHWVWFLPATAAVAAWCHRAGGRWRWWLLVAAACVYWTGPMRYMPKNDLRELTQNPAQQLVTNSFALLALLFLVWAAYTTRSSAARNDRP